MATVTDGLTEGGAPPADPFEAALESKGVMGGGSSASLSVADGLTFGGNEADTDTSTVDDNSADGTTDEQETETDTTTGDPEVDAYLARFDGDADKALKAAAEAQKVIGRQGNELGELKQTVAKLEGMVEQIGRTPPPAAAPAVQMDRAEIEAQVEANGGVSMATWAANNAPHLVDSVLEVWAEDEPFKAMKFDREYQAWKATQETASAATSEPSKTEKYVEEQMENERAGKAFNAVAKEFPNFDDFKEYIGSALEASGPVVAKLASSTDDAEQLAGIKIVFERAERMAAAEATKTATDSAKTAATERKRTAQVIRGSSGSPPDPKTQGVEGDAKARAEEEVQKFKASLLAAESTSVSDGLTFGK